jgi:hypothetical protein
MNLYIQMGHGMQSLCRELAELWNGSTVILSPVDIAQDKLTPFAESLHRVNGQVLLDPQMYRPLKFHRNLQRYSYWPKSVANIELDDYYDIISTLSNINAEIRADEFILPSNIINHIDEHWHKLQDSIANRAGQIDNRMRLLHTVALGPDVLADDNQVESIIRYASQWAVDGVYIVCEHPDSYYLVNKPIWVANLLALVAGIKRLGKKVIVGYASHQLLCLALAKCDAIATGNFLNVRWFKPERFETNHDDEPSRRSTWYYCPQAFSEYKVTYLDVAKRANILSRLEPPEIMANEYSRVLFQGAMPSETNYKEGNSYRHYLHCLKIQCDCATKPTYAETRDAHLALLSTATLLTTGLREEKVKGQDRDFGEITDVIEAAISLFDKEFGFAMSQEWSN